MKKPTQTFLYALGENGVMFKKVCHAQKSTNHMYATQITGANQSNDPIQLSDEQQSLIDVFHHAWMGHSIGENRKRLKIRNTLSEIPNAMQLKLLDSQTT